MRLDGVLIEDTFAEAFPMRYARVVVTAASERWARAAAGAMTGFATSVIGCKCEAGLERMLAPDDTPDGRPGASVLLFAMDGNGVGERLVERVGQTVLTCPTTACYDGLPTAERRVRVGEALRFFGDGFQGSKVVAGRRFWRIPVMDGEFLVEAEFGVGQGVGGGNFLIMATDADAALAAAERAVAAIGRVPAVILPFPGGVVRSGSKIRSRRYAWLRASTNDAYAPTLRGSTASALPDGVNAVLEIVIDGEDPPAVEAAMRAGIAGACGPGVVAIGAGNYGGQLGPHQFPLRRVMDGVSVDAEART